jgi:hypothetical protein
LLEATNKELVDAEKKNMTTFRLKSTFSICPSGWFEFVGQLPTEGNQVFISLYGSKSDRLKIRIIKSTNQSQLFDKLGYKLDLYSIHGLPPGGHLYITVVCKPTHATLVINGQLILNVSHPTSGFPDYSQFRSKSFSRLLKVKFTGCK